MSFEIITDSAANLSPEYVKKHDVMMMSLKYYIGENEYDSYIDTPNDSWLKKFYDIMRSKAMATTSCLNSEFLTSYFTSILDKGKDFIYLAFSSKLSATYEIANDAAEKLREKYPERKFYVVDTKCVCAGLGLFVDYVVDKRSSGWDIDKTHEWVKDNYLKICHWFTVDDLFFLKRGGRVNTAAAIAGTVLGVKPVLHVDNAGALVPVSKVRGRKQSLIAMVDRMEETAINPEKQRVFITHGDCFEDMKFTEKLIRDRLGVKEVITGYLNPIIGSHSGPGTVAVFFFGEER